MILFLLLALQQGPPAPVTYDSPARSRFSEAHDCNGYSVRFDYEAVGWLSRQPTGVRVTRYQAGRSRMSGRQMSVWNTALRGVAQFRSVEVLCQTRERAAITVIGSDTAGRLVRVTAQLAGSEVLSVR